MGLHVGGERLGLPVMENLPGAGKDFRDFFKKIQTEFQWKIFLGKIR